MNCVTEIIRREILRHGPISVARFMDLALYSPETGYYERQKNIGRHGDFYTSASVGPLFGQLLAFQFADWLAHNDRTENSTSHLSKANPGPLTQIMEGGAHDGHLAAEILGSMRQWRPEAFARLEYWILEPSNCHETWQRETLREFGDRVRWFKSWSALPKTGVRGVIFSNELLDAMPVLCGKWDSTRRIWRERKVDWQNEHFVWKDEILFEKMKSSLPAFFQQAAEQSPHDFQIEIAPAAANWWQAAATKLKKGKLLAIDYGYTEGEILPPGGTLRAYFRHHVADDILANAGEQDITAHVNFSELQRVGEATGLKTDGLISQAKFLTQIVEQGWKTPSHFLEWNSQCTRQFQTLTHPEHLGRPFRVLSQTKP